MATDPEVAQVMAMGVKKEDVIEMDKKILSVFLLLIIVISATVLFVSFRDTFSQEDSQDYSTGEEITDEDVSKEIDDAFLSEDDEVEIGEMV